MGVVDGGPPTALAFAATTEVLRYIVDRALQHIFETTLLGTPKPKVTTGAPPRPSAVDGADPSVVNLFLYGASRVQSPLRGRADRPFERFPPSNWELDYLVSAHGPEWVREVGYATAMEALDQTPVVTRELMREALVKSDSATDPVLMPNRIDEKTLEAFDVLTIMPASLDIGTITSLWTAAQSPLRPSACYRVRVQFLEAASPRD